MKTQDKERILSELKCGQEALSAALRGTTEAIAARTPASGWSIRECVEHVAIAEDYLFARIDAARHSDTPILDTRRQQAIVTRGLDRSASLEAPEATRPTGRFATLSDALGHFMESRERTIRWVEACPDDPHAELTSHPLIGVVSCYEILLLIAVHPRRHAQQIEAIRAQLD